MGAARLVVVLFAVGCSAAPAKPETGNGVIKPEKLASKPEKKLEKKAASNFFSFKEKPAKPENATRRLQGQGEGGGSGDNAARDPVTEGVDPVPEAEDEGGRDIPLEEGRAWDGNHPPTDSCPAGDALNSFLQSQLAAYATSIETMAGAVRNSARASSADEGLAKGDLPKLPRWMI